MYVIGSFVPKIIVQTNTQHIDWFELMANTSRHLGCAGIEFNLTGPVTGTTGQSDDDATLTKIPP